MARVKKKKILFIAYGGGHVRMIVPLVHELLKRPDTTVTVLGLTTAGKILEKKGIPYIGFRDIIRQDDTRAFEMGRELCQGLVSDLIPIEETIAYLGLSYADLEERLGVNEAREAYRLKGRQAFLPLTVMMRLFKELQPDLVVTTISPRAEEAAIMTAHSMGIKSLCMTDHFSGPATMKAKEPWYGNVVTVLSERVKNSLVEAGRNPDDIVVTGNPAFDELANTDISSQAASIRASRGWGKDRVILWASNIEPARHPTSGAPGDPHLPRNVEAALLKIIKTHPEWRLVLRPHPNEHIDYGQLPDRVESSGAEDNLNVLLSAVDVVIVLVSAVGLQARFLGKPLVSIEESMFCVDASYRAAGLSLGVDSLDKLEAVLEKAITKDADYPEGFPPCGEATENVLKVIYRMCENI